MTCEVKSARMLPIFAKHSCSFAQDPEFFNDDALYDDLNFDEVHAVTLDLGIKDDDEEEPTPEPAPAPVAAKQFVPLKKLPEPTQLDKKVRPQCRDG